MAEVNGPTKKQQDLALDIVRAAYRSSGMHEEIARDVILPRLVAHDADMQKQVLLHERTETLRKAAEFAGPRGTCPRCTAEDPAKYVDARPHDADCLFAPPTKTETAGTEETMAECNLVGGPPHVWAPHGPVDAKCQRCGVQQNWHGVWDGLMRLLDERLAEVKATREVLEEIASMTTDAAVGKMVREYLAECAAAGQKK
jgi:hypothetical protein